MSFGYCLGSENGTRSLRVGDLSSMTLFTVAVDAQNDFGEETNRPKGEN